ncbi:MAG: hypothetical protein IK066_09085 [Kiritimatiellae bacterium]|nr:hypothetical protein [Kiritimatiellia bacterium]
MGGAARRGARGARAWAVAALVAASAAFGGGCVREVLEPVRETRYVTTRSGEDVTLTWVAQRGLYYNVMYTNGRGAGARWTLHPQGMNLRAARDGEQMSITDRLAPGEERYYRLQTDTKPLTVKR